MNVLITGQNGFIGQALFREMRSQGFLVRGTVRNRPKNNQDIVAVGDIGPATDWSSALAGIDVVVHLANRAHILHDSAKDPLALFREVNVEGTIALAQQAVEQGVKRFVFISSIKVNGECTYDTPFAADDSPNPQGPYAVSKLEAETRLRKIGEESTMETVILRPPLVYGQGVKGNFQRLTSLVETGVPLPLASIQNQRSLISLERLIEIIILCVTQVEVANQICLVSDGEDLSTPELVRKIAESIGKPARLFPFPVKLLKIVGKLMGQREVVDRLVDNLQLDVEKTKKILNL